MHHPCERTQLHIWDGVVSDVDLPDSLLLHSSSSQVSWTSRPCGWMRWTTTTWGPTATKASRRCRWGRATRWASSWTSTRPTSHNHAARKQHALRLLSHGLHPRNRHKLSPYAAVWNIMPTQQKAEPGRVGPGRAEPAVTATRSQWKQ